jgi:hypothetical protein
VSLRKVGCVVVLGRCVLVCGSVLALFPRGFLGSLRKAMGWRLTNPGFAGICGIAVWRGYLCIRVCVCAGEDFQSGCGVFPVMVVGLVASLARSLSEMTGRPPSECEGALRAVYLRGLSSRDDVWLKLARDRLVWGAPAIPAARGFGGGVS